MIKLIGIILFAFGAIGVLVTLFLSRWLTRPGGPLQKLQNLLTSNTSRLQHGMELAQKAIEITKETLPHLEGVNNKIGDITGNIAQQVDPGVESLFSLMDNAATSLTQAKGALNTVKIPLLATRTTRIEKMGFRFKVVTGIEFTAPPKVVLDEVGMDIPAMDIPGFDISSFQDLTSAGEALGNIGNKLNFAKDKFKNIHDDIVAIRGSLGQALKLIRTFTEQAPNILFSISNDLLLSQQVVSQYKLLAIIPLLGLGYLGLLHLAFILVGLALLFI